MRGSIGFHRWSNIHSLLWKPVSPAIKLARKQRTDGALIRYKRVGHRSPPPRYKASRAAAGRR